MAQNTTDHLHNSTVANITQLATILPTVDEPVTSASFAPVIEKSDESASSSNNDGDDNDGSVFWMHQTEMPLISIIKSLELSAIGLQKLIQLRYRGP
jgi:hypothetical protein